MNNSDDCQEKLSGCLHRPLSPIIPPEKLIEFYKELGKRVQESQEIHNRTRDNGPKESHDTRREKEHQKNGISVRLRTVAWLWDALVPLNVFGTDGPKNVPNTWPGDRHRECRQWHGIDLAFEKEGNVIVRNSIKVVTQEYVGVTSMCGILGKASITDRFVSEPRIAVDDGGEYVEVKSLLGSRLGAYIPDLDVGVAAGSVMEAGWLGSIHQHIIEEMIEDQAEERYLGTNSWVAKIYDFVRLKVYFDGRSEGTFVSKTPGNGFQTTEEIIDEEISYSWMPEHHLYLNDQHVDAKVPQSSDGWDEMVNWIDSWRPFDVMAFVVLNDAINYWCRNASLEDKLAVAQKFKDKHPNYYVGTDF